MSLISSIFGGRRSNVFDPFSLDLWDPFEGFFFGGNSSFLSNSAFPRETPALVNVKIDWKETPEAYAFKADRPGLKEEEGKVEVEDGRVLQISGDGIHEKEEKNKTWHRIERNSSRFQRRFRLPENPKMEELKAYLCRMLTRDHRQILVEIIGCR